MCDDFDEITDEQWNDFFDKDWNDEDVPDAENVGDDNEDNDEGDDSHLPKDPVLA